MHTNVNTRLHTNINTAKHNPVPFLTLQARVAVAQLEGSLRTREREVERLSKALEGNDAAVVAEAALRDAGEAQLKLGGELAQVGVAEWHDTC